MGRKQLAGEGNVSQIAAIGMNAGIEDDRRAGQYESLSWAEA
jgi:hypothetical protein